VTSSWLEPADAALVDHHVHGFVTGDLDRPAFELLISESGRPPPRDTSHFDTPIGLAILRHCAPVLGLDPWPSPDDYLEVRAKIGWRGAGRLFLQAAGVQLLLVDTGHRGGEVTSPDAMTALGGVATAEVVRVETIAERLADEVSGPSQWAAELGGALRRAATGAVGLKTIVAYRYGLDLPSEPPGRAEVGSALDRWYATGDANGRGRLEDPALLRLVLHEAIDVAADEGLVVQVHTGFGDTDLDLPRADPVVFTPWLRRLDHLGVDVAFLHCYPYHRQAGYLAEAYPHAYFDVGCALNYTGPSAGRVLAEAMEMAPFTKQLYSSDAFGLPELIFLGAVQFRRHLTSLLDRWVRTGDCPPPTAGRVAEMVTSGNAHRIYPFHRAVKERTPD
jgi:predicted TIM-barrel fold metal-dependent hydrolase